jgi:hypothetical protein
MADHGERRTDGPSWSRPMAGQEPEPDSPDTSAPAGPSDDAIRAVVTRLARRHPSGGVVIERAAILAEGADCAAVVAWIVAHDGQPEEAVASATKRGLHSARLSDSIASESRAPLRYVLPAGATA